MRIWPLWLPRRVAVPRLRRAYGLRTALPHRTPPTLLPFRSSATIHSYVSPTRSSVEGYYGLQQSVRSPSTAKEQEAQVNGRAPDPPKKALSEDDKFWRWLSFLNRRLDPFLPTALRLVQGSTLPQSQDVAELVRLLKRSQYQSTFKFDLLAHLFVSQDRKPAALFLVNLLLDHTADTKVQSQAEAASTVRWTNIPVETLFQHAVCLEKSQPVSPSCSLEDQYSTLPDRDMEAQACVWSFLGALVIHASQELPAVSAEIMSTVHRILARLHHLDLIPHNIYDYTHSPLSTTIRRPPLMHLLSSRILSTLSDATWRNYQSESLARAAESGSSYVHTQDPFGGRFRLKVRELGPEVWLEFILWCCVESDCPQAATFLVSVLSQKGDQPWFAVNWTANASGRSAVQIDWDRVKGRTGGTVGRIEAYSFDKPLAEAPPRTISVEVIVALIEATIDAGHRARETSRASKIMTDSVRLLLGFLEPHSLDEDYIDYVSARLLNASSDGAGDIRNVADTVTQLRGLKAASQYQEAPTGLNFRCIVQQSEVYPSILHVAMHTSMCRGHLREGIDLFNHIQSVVDASKMQAITSFLKTSVASNRNFFEPAPTSREIDFTLSHGQITDLKLGAFLGVLVNNNVVPLAEWLIYSTDADGTLLPRSKFHQYSVALALTRFAATQQDAQLLHYVMAAIRENKLKPPVNLLCAIVNAEIACRHFPAAHTSLKALTRALYGGFHPDNVACVAAAILRLESEAAHSVDTATSSNYLQEAVILMESMLRGVYDPNPGDFYIVQRQLHDQRIGHILRICGSLKSPALKQVESRFAGKFMSYNSPSLTAKAFNDLLRAVVDCQGYEEGIRMWQTYCQPPIHGTYDHDIEFAVEDEAEDEFKVDDCDAMPLTPQILPLANDPTLEGQSTPATEPGAEVKWDRVDVVTMPKTLQSSFQGMMEQARSVNDAGSPSHNAQSAFISENYRAGQPSAHTDLLAEDRWHKIDVVTKPKTLQSSFQGMMEQAQSANEADSAMQPAQCAPTEENHHHQSDSPQGKSTDQKSPKQKSPQQKSPEQKSPEQKSSIQNLPERHVPAVIPNVHSLRIIANDILDHARATYDTAARRRARDYLERSPWVAEQFQAFDLTSELREARSYAHVESVKSKRFREWELENFRKGKNEYLPLGGASNAQTRVGYLFSGQEAWRGRLPMRKTILDHDANRLEWLEDAMRRDGHAEGGEVEGDYDAGLDDGDGYNDDSDGRAGHV